MRNCNRVTPFAFAIEDNTLQLKDKSGHCSKGIVLYENLYENMKMTKQML